MFSHIFEDLSPLHSVSDGRACQECMNPALGGVMLPQAHSHYDSHATDTNAPNNMLTHIKADMDS